MKGNYVGDKNPMFGKTQSDDFKENQRIKFLISNPGKNKTEETKRKMSESELPTHAIGDGMGFVSHHSH